MTKILTTALALASSLALAGPSLAQNSPPPAAPPAQPKLADTMGEVVCQKVEVPGSRVATKRVCMTRLQWQEQRTQDRQDIEHVQIHPDLGKPGG